jgi:hypothetical protein
MAPAYITLNNEKESNIMETQADTVLKHLKLRGTINQSTASGMYGINRLAAVVHRINQKNPGTIRARRRRGIRSTYVEYAFSGGA